jgi:hypothetical protein
MGIYCGNTLHNASKNRYGLLEASLRDRLFFSSLFPGGGGVLAGGDGVGQGRGIYAFFIQSKKFDVIF